MNIENMMKRLTFNYEKSRSSNIYKLFSIIADEIEEIQTAFLRTLEFKSIDRASGVSLDEIGDLVSLDRNGSSDEQYRVRLKFKAAQNKSKPDINSIIGLLSSVLNADDVRIYEKFGEAFQFSDIADEPQFQPNGFADIDMLSGGELEGRFEPASYYIAFRRELLEKTGLSISEFVELVESISAAGVKVYPDYIE